MGCTCDTADDEDDYVEDCGGDECYEEQGGDDDSDDNCWDDECCWNPDACEGGDADIDTDADTDTDTDTDTSGDPDTWYDESTDLCWENPAVSGTYLADHCEDLGEPWRMPTINELMSLIIGCDQLDCGVTDPECLDYPGCADGCDDNCPPMEGPGPEGCYWHAELGGDCEGVLYESTSSLNGDDALSWFVNFYRGMPESDTEDTVVRIRCVRTGSCPLDDEE